MAQPIAKLESQIDNRNLCRRTLTDQQEIDLFVYINYLQEVGLELDRQCLMEEVNEWWVQQYGHRTRNIGGK